MSSVVINGDTSGAITVTVPSVAGTNTITLPALTGTVLTTASTGTVLQVVNANYATETSSATSTLVATGLTATITPKFSTSKILVIAMINGCYKDTSNTSITSYLTKNAGNLKIMSYIAAATNDTSASDIGTIGINYLDSPATTSATTYACTFASQQNVATVYVQKYSSTSTITLIEVAG